MLSGLVIACRFAGNPTNLSPDAVIATTDGVVRLPSWFSITLVAFVSEIAIQEFVVPRSIPITLFNISN